MSPEEEGSEHTVPAATSATAADSGDIARLELEGAARYVDLGELGRGGMGEVRLTRDLRLDRDVACKRMRGALTHPDYARRFLREVRVQGQLEHPAVVPVYELGVTPEGDPYFTMKRVRGQTLQQVLLLLAEGDPVTCERFSRYRLLAAFNTVCLAIDSAHSRGVLHRDLKPGNIMLGDFGEVHVLDWGLARVRGQRDESSGPPIRGALGGDHTALGSAMGTPGYMSPEQAQGQLDTLDERTDVFALGVILRQVLFLEPGPNAPTRPASAPRAGSTKVADHDVAPELDAVWRQACAARPEDRFSSARALGEAVERFLEGERDGERRRALAQVQLRLAAQAQTDTHSGRGQALQALGRALALDPTNSSALQGLSTLLAEPPAQTPPEAQRQLRDLAAARARQLMTATAVRLLSWCVGLGLSMVLLGVRSVPLAVGLFATLLVATATTWALSRRAEVLACQVASAVLSLVIIALLAVLVNPLLVMPSLAATHAMLFAASVPAPQRTLMTVAAALTVLGPVVFTPLGPYVQPQAAALVISSPLLRFERAATPVVLVLLSLIPVVTPSLLVGRLRDAFVAAERTAVIQSAALRQLIPRGESQQSAEEPQ